MPPGLALEKWPRLPGCCGAHPQVVRSAQNYTEAARDEVTLLQQIRDNDPDNSSHCVRLLDQFEHAGPHGSHVCEVFEPMGDDLLTLIRQALAQRAGRQAGEARGLQDFLAHCAPALPGCAGRTSTAASRCTSCAT